MEELLEMRQLLEAHRYPEALELLAQLEEMSRDDKVNKIRSFLNLLLLHLIKQRAEEKSTVSWDVSIDNSLKHIYLTNHRRTASGVYVAAEDMQELIGKEFRYALRAAALEAFGGSFSPDKLLLRFDAETLKADALRMILNYTED